MLFLEAFTMTNEQFGVLFSCYAWVATLTYFLGGIVADKFSPRKLLTISFLGTGLLNLWFGTFPPYNVAIVIYALLGITTTLTFWAALIKATRQFGRNAGSESKAYGGREAGASFFEVLVGTFAAWMFTLLYRCPWDCACHIFIWRYPHISGCSVLVCLYR